jgi:hypothetical protein
MTNYFQLTLHAVVLTLNLILVIIYSLPAVWLNDRQWDIVEIILIVTETTS